MLTMTVPLHNWNLHVPKKQIHFKWKDKERAQSKTGAVLTGPANLNEISSKLVPNAWDVGHSTKFVLVYIPYIL